MLLFYLLAGEVDPEAVFNWSKDKSQLEFDQVISDKY